MPFDVEISEGPSEFKKQREAVDKKLQAASKKSDSKVLKRVAKEVENKDNSDVREKTKLAEMLFHESLDMFRDGEMTFKEFTNDLNEALKAVA